jgi:hypothetical protein
MLIELKSGFSCMVGWNQVLTVFPQVQAVWMALWLNKWTASRVLMPELMYMRPAC